jgi:hypothetical protein
MFAVRIWITMSLPQISRKSSVHLQCCLLPPRCTEDVYSPQRSTRDLWTLLLFVPTAVVLRLLFFKLGRFRKVMLTMFVRYLVWQGENCLFRLTSFACNTVLQAWPFPVPCTRISLNSRAIWSLKSVGIMHFNCNVSRRYIVHESTGNVPGIHVY